MEVNQRSMQRLGGGNGRAVLILNNNIMNDTLVCSNGRISVDHEHGRQWHLDTEVSGLEGGWYLEVTGIGD